MILESSGLISFLLRLYGRSLRSSLSELLSTRIVIGKKESNIPESTELYKDILRVGGLEIQMIARLERVTSGTLFVVWYFWWCMK